MKKCNVWFSDLWSTICHSRSVGTRKYFFPQKLPNVKLGLLAITLIVAACGGGGGGGSGSNSSGSATSSFVVSGTVSAPSGAVAFLPRKNLLEQLADAFVSSAYAEISGFAPVADGTTVVLVRINNSGAVLSELATTTTSGGSYSFNLTALGLSTASDLVVQVRDSSSQVKMRAFVASGTVNIDPVSETATRIVLEKTITSSLSNFTTKELTDIYSAAYLFALTQPLSSGLDIESTVTAFKSAMLADANLAAFITAASATGQIAQGLGDIGNYFPFSQGYAWVYQGTEQSNGITHNYSNTRKITGTKAINGITTTIFHETNSGNIGAVSEDYLLKTSQGVTDYGNNYAPDFLTPQVAPYQEYLFPLGLNSSFTAINKSGLIWPDEDSDGIPETASLNTTVAVAAFEVITVSSGTYANAVKIVTNITISIILSSDGSTAVIEDNVAEWYAPGVGLVKNITASQTSVDNVVTDISTTTEELSKFSKPLVLASIAVGNGHTCGLTPQGKAYCWGDDSVGQLGIGKAVCNSTPQNACPPIPPGEYPNPRPMAVTGELVFTSLTLSSNISCGITNTGAAYCWGTHGMTESYGTFSSGTPMLETGNFNFTSFSVHKDPFGYVKCGIVSGGEAYCWGDNSDGQLGSGLWYDIKLSPQLVSGGHYFSFISVGESHTCGLTVDGAAYCWGQNYYGQLGNGTTYIVNQLPMPVSGGLAFTSMRVGGNYSCGWTMSGAAYCWGADLLTTVATTAPTQPNISLAVKSVSGTHDRRCLLSAAGDAYCPESTGTFELVPGGIKFVSISNSATHACGVATDGFGYCWGNNSVGQLGDGTQINRSIPMQVKLLE